MSANKPMAFKSTPSERNHAGNREIRIYSGKPELKPVKMQMSMRLLSNTRLMLVLFVTGHLSNGKGRTLQIALGLIGTTAPH
jgi:hypothetical protein